MMTVKMIRETSGIFCRKCIRQKRDIINVCLFRSIFRQLPNFPDDTLNMSVASDSHEIISTSDITNNAKDLEVQLTPSQ